MMAKRANSTLLLRRGSCRSAGRSYRHRYLALCLSCPLCLLLVVFKTVIYPAPLPINKYEWATAIGSAISSASRLHNTQNVANNPPRYKAYPFHFSCPAVVEDLPSLHRPYEVALVYHVNMANNWRDILHDQMIAITSCGLGRIASKFIISYCNGHPSDLKEALVEYEAQLGSIKMDLVHNSIPKDHSLGLQAAKDHCSSVSAKHKGVKTVQVVFHFHNSGATDYQPDWYIHSKRNDEGPYSRSLYWRKYAEHFVMERPRLCLEKIVNDGALTCGVNLRPRYDDVGDNGNATSLPLSYAEDIWAASCPIARPKKRDKKKHAELHRTKKRRSDRLIHPEDYASSANRFHLTCPRFEMDEDGSDYQILLAYHIGFLNNWREVTMDQLQTLSTCGLGKAASIFMISHSNATASDLQELQRMIEEREIDLHPVPIEASNMPYEGPIMNAVRDTCRSVKLKTVVFYFHNKGVSRYTSDWNKKGNIDKSSSEWKKSPYAFLLYWRKYMEYFTIERPALCIEAIRDGAWACGVNMQPSHYSGNMYVADCDYIKTLAPVTGTGYLDAEAFIGRGMNKNTFMQGRFMDLHKAPPAGKAGYRHLMLPEEYVIRSS